MKNKIMAFFVAVAMLASTGAVSAEKYIATELPETGVIVFDDFNDSPIHIDDNAKYRAEMRGDNLFGSGTKVWHAFYDSIETVNTMSDHGVAAVVSSARSGTNGAVGAMYYNSASSPFGKTDIGTGRILLSYDIYIPGGRDLGSNVRFWLNNSFWGGSHGYPVNIVIDSDGATLCFKTQADLIYHDSLGDAVQSTLIDLDYDRWYSIGILIDYEEGTMNYYLDGNHTAKYKGSETSLRNYMTFNEVDFAISGGVQDGNTEIYLDNIKLERLGNDFGAEIVSNTEDTIDVKFDYIVDETAIAALNTSKFTLTKGEETINVSAIEKIAPDTVKFTLASALSTGAEYKLVLGEKISSAWGKANEIPEGSKIQFVTAPAMKEDILYENNFDDYGFADRAEALANTEIGFYWGKGNDAWGGDAGYVFQRTTAPEDPNGGKYFNFARTDFWAETRQGVWFNFNDGKKASNGKLVAEFDLKISDAMVDIDGEKDQAHNNDAFFGFRDDTKYTGRGASGSAIPGTVFMVNAVASAAASQNRSIARGDVKYIDKITSKTDRSLLVAKTVDAEDEWHTYKIEVDLDNDNFTIYRDGVYLNKSNYMPGNYKNGVYSNFVVGAAGPRSSTSEDAFNVGIDNLKVTNIMEYPVIKNAKFVKYDDTENDYEAVVSAGTKQVKFVFSTPVDDKIIPYITVAGVGADSAVITPDGSTVTIDFENCLQPGTEYTVTVDAAAVNANGLELGNEAVYTFTADAGEIIFAVPSIKEGYTVISDVSSIETGDEITVEVPVINTSAEDANAYVVLTSYAGGKLTGVIPLKYHLSADDVYSDTAEIIVEADATLANADTVKSFVFNNLVTKNPLADAAVVTSAVTE